MRGTFVRTLVEIAAHDPRVLFLTGDLGYGAVEPFADAHPKRFFNVGVAEQNMVGLATGLAESGFLPFCYSIVNFAVLRPYEFIRNGPVLHHLPVRIVGVGGGLEYGHNGITHYGLEDVGVLRIQPGLTVLAPADAEQTANALRATWDLPGPVYFRLGKDDRVRVPGLDGQFALGRAQRVREGRDVLLVTMGSVATEAVAAAEALAAQGVQAGILVVASVSPPPVEDLAAALGEVSTVVTVEAHYVTGGVGSLVAEVIAEQGLNCRLVRTGVRTRPDGLTGEQGYLYQRHGIAGDALVQAVLTQLDRVPLTVQ
jgi:transketolase